MQQLRILFFMLACCSILIGSSAFGVMNMDLFGGYVPKPSDVQQDVRSGYVFGGGLGVDLIRVVPWIMWQIRFDFQYTQFLGGFQPCLYVSSGGFRWLFGGGQLPVWLVPLFDVGGEIRIRNKFVLLDSGKKRLSVGPYVGFGIEFYPLSLLYLSVRGRWHFVDNFFMDILFASGIRF